MRPTKLEKLPYYPYPYQTRLSETRGVKTRIYLRSALQRLAEINQPTEAIEKIVFIGSSPRLPWK
jgi:hypothetical protein